MFKVYQIELTDALVTEINADSGSAKSLARFSAVCHGDVVPAMKRHLYKHVANVDADLLEDAFELMNHWGDPTKVERLGQVHSLSVGDVLIDAVGVPHICKPFGWEAMTDTYGDVFELLAQA